MSQTKQEQGPTIAGSIEFGGRRYEAEDFLLELENLAATLSDAEHGLIGLGYEEQSHWVLAGSVLSRVRAMSAAART